MEKEIPFSLFFVSHIFSHLLPLLLSMWQPLLLMMLSCCRYVWPASPFVTPLLVPCLLIESPVKTPFCQHNRLTLLVAFGGSSPPTTLSPSAAAVVGGGTFPLDSGNPYSEVEHDFSAWTWMRTASPAADGSDVESIDRMHDCLSRTHSPTDASRRYLCLSSRLLTSFHFSNSRFWKIEERRRSRSIDQSHAVSDPQFNCNSAHFPAVVLSLSRPPGVQMAFPVSRSVPGDRHTDRNATLFLCLPHGLRSPSNHSHPELEMRGHCETRGERGKSTRIPRCLPSLLPHLRSKAQSQHAAIV